MWQFNFKKVFISLVTIFLITLIATTSVLFAQSSASLHLNLSNSSLRSAGLKQSSSKSISNKEKMLPLSKNTNLNSHLSDDDKIVRVNTLPAPGNDGNDLIFVMTESDTSNKFNTFKLFDSVDGGKNFESTIDSNHGLTGKFQIAYPHTNFFADVNHDLFLNVDPGGGHNVAKIYCLQYNNLIKTGVSKFKFNNITPTSYDNDDVNYISAYSVKNDDDLTISNIYFSASNTSTASVDIWMYDINSNKILKMIIPNTLTNCETIELFHEESNWRVFLLGRYKEKNNSNSRALYYYTYSDSIRLKNNNLSFSDVDISALKPNKYNTGFISYANKTLFISFSYDIPFHNSLPCWYATNIQGTFDFNPLYIPSKPSAHYWDHSVSLLKTFNNRVYFLVYTRNLGVTSCYYEIFYTKSLKDNKYEVDELSKITNNYSFKDIYKTSKGLYFNFVSDSKKSYLYLIDKTNVLKLVLTSLYSGVEVYNVVSTKIGTYVLQTNGCLNVAYNDEPTNFESIISTGESSEIIPSISILKDNESLYFGINQTLYTQFSAIKALRFSDNSMTRFKDSSDQIYYLFDDNTQKTINPDMTYFNTSNATFNKAQYPGGQLTLTAATQRNAGIDTLNIGTNVDKNPNSIKPYIFITEISAWGAISINTNGYDHYVNDVNLMTNIKNQSYPIISAWNDKNNEHNDEQFEIKTKPTISLGASYYEHVKFINNQIMPFSSPISFNNNPIPIFLDSGIYKFHIVDSIDNQVTEFIAEIGYSNQQIPFKFNNQNWQQMKEYMQYDGITTNATYNSTELYLPFDNDTLNNFKTFLYKYGYSADPKNAFSILSKKIADSYKFIPSDNSLQKNVITNNLNISNVANFAKSSISMNTFFNSSKLWNDYSSKIASEYMDGVNLQINNAKHDATLFNIKNPNIGSGINNSAQLNSYLGFVKDYKSAVERKTQSWLSSSDCKAYQNLVTLGWGVDSFQYKPILSSGTIATLPFTWNSNLTVSQAINKYYSIDKLKLEYKTEVDNEFTTEHPNNLQKTPELYQTYQIKKIEDSIDTHGHSLIDILNYAKIGTSKLPKPINKAQLLNYHDQKSYQQYLQIESDAYNYDLSDHNKNQLWIYEILIPIAGAIFIGFFVTFLVFALRRNSRKIAEQEKYKRQYAQQHAAKTQGFREPNLNMNQRKRIITPKDVDPIVVTPIKIKKEKSKLSNLEANGKKLLNNPINMPKSQVTVVQNKQSKGNKEEPVKNKKITSDLNKKQIQKSKAKDLSSSDKPKNTKPSN